jgi:hypothetical protein
MLLDLPPVVDTIEATELEHRNDESIITAKLTGNFPGSPVDLINEFTIGDAAVEALRIHP